MFHLFCVFFRIRWKMYTFQKSLFIKMAQHNSFTANHFEDDNNSLKQKPFCFLESVALTINAPWLTSFHVAEVFFIHPRVQSTKISSRVVIQK